MIDREKLITALGQCLGDDLCSGCPYRIPDNYISIQCRINMMRDCLEALKEQQETINWLVRFCERGDE